MGKNKQQKVLSSIIYDADRDVRLFDIKHRIGKSTIITHKDSGESITVWPQDSIVENGRYIIKPWCDKLNLPVAMGNTPLPTMEGVEVYDYAVRLIKNGGH